MVGKDSEVSPKAQEELVRTVVGGCLNCRSCLNYQELAEFVFSVTAR